MLAVDFVPLYVILRLLRCFSNAKLAIRKTTLLLYHAVLMVGEKGKLPGYNELPNHLRWL